jgi:cobalamin biosynthesis protein CobD/CbiB
MITSILGRKCSLKRSRVVVIGFVLAFWGVAAGADRIGAVKAVSADAEPVESVLERYVRACGGAALGAVRTETEVYEVDPMICPRCSVTWD